jgi:hypothetical protein
VHGASAFVRPGRLHAKVAKSHPTEVNQMVGRTQPDDLHRWFIDEVNRNGARGGSWLGGRRHVERRMSLE